MSQTSAFRFLFLAVVVVDLNSTPRALCLGGTMFLQVSHDSLLGSLAVVGHGFFVRGRDEVQRGVAGHFEAFGGGVRGGIHGLLLEVLK